MKTFQVTHNGHTGYYTQWENRNDFFPVGGGFSILAFPSNATITEVDSIPTDMVQGVCYFEDGPKYKCMCNPIDLWNGWHKPFLFASEAPKWIAELNSNGNTASIDSNGTLAIIINESEGEPYLIPLKDGLYDLSDMGWCWDFKPAK